MTWMVYVPGGSSLAAKTPWEFVAPPRSPIRLGEVSRILALATGAPLWSTTVMVALAVRVPWAANVPPPARITVKQLRVARGFLIDSSDRFQPNAEVRLSEKVGCGSSHNC
jgi:hypothetical protein